MKKNIKIIVLFLFLSFLLSSCFATVEEKLQKEAVKHFKSKYDLTVKVTRTQQVQMPDGPVLYLLDVSAGEEKYNLFFDNKNKPLADNYAIINLTKDIERNIFTDILNEAGLSLSEDPFYNHFSYDDKKYVLYLNTERSSVPDSLSLEAVFNILPELAKNSVQFLNIAVVTPDYFKPRPEFGQKDETIKLTTVSINVDFTLDKITEMFSETEKLFYWDESKFNDFISDMKSKGIKNPYFYLTRAGIASRVNLCLYGESTDKNAADMVNEELNKIDESYISLGIFKIIPKADIVNK